MGSGKQLMAWCYVSGLVMQSVSPRNRLTVTSQTHSYSSETTHTPEDRWVVHMLFALVQLFQVCLLFCFQMLSSVKCFGGRVVIGCKTVIYGFV